MTETLLLSARSVDRTIVIARAISIASATSRLFEMCCLSWEAATHALFPWQRALRSSSNKTHARVQVRAMRVYAARAMRVYAARAMRVYAARLRCACTLRCC
jgi:hypothetical protein